MVRAGPLGMFTAEGTDGGDFSLGKWLGQFRQVLAIQPDLMRLEGKVKVIPILVA